MSERLHRYGLIFWSGRDEDSQTWTWFESTDYFNAEKTATKFKKPEGLISGGLHYILEPQWYLYTTKTEDFCNGR